MPRKLSKLPKPPKRDNRGPIDLTETITILSELRAQWASQGLPGPTEVWLGPLERSGLLAVIMEKTRVTRDADLMRAVLQGDPEGTTLMGLVVRSMTKPGVRLGITHGPNFTKNG